jgi:hypothetical protein
MRKWGTFKNLPQFWCGAKRENLVTFPNLTRFPKGGDTASDNSAAETGKRAHIPERAQVSVTRIGGVSIALEG